MFDPTAPYGTTIGFRSAIPLGIHIALVDHSEYSSIQPALVTKVADFVDFITESGWLANWGEGPLAMGALFHWTTASLQLGHSECFDLVPLPTHASAQVLHFQDRLISFLNHLRGLLQLLPKRPYHVSFRR